MTILTNSLMLTVVGRGQADHFIEIAHECGCTGGTVYPAMGTASSSILRRFGLGDKSKDVILNVVSKDVAYRIIEKVIRDPKILGVSAILENNSSGNDTAGAKVDFAGSENGSAGAKGECAGSENGTAGAKVECASSENGSAGAKVECAASENGTAGAKGESAGSEKVSYGAKSVEEDSMNRRWKMITIIVNKGYADDIMDTARKAGASGGTITNARGTAPKDSEHSFLGITIVPEKEMVIILSEREKAASIVEAVRNMDCLQEKGIGIIYTQDVVDFVNLGSK